MPSGKVIILTGSHLSNNPRVIKEADALSKAGFDVEVLGWIAEARLAAEDDELLKTRKWSFTPVANLLDKSFPARISRFWWKVQRRIAYTRAQFLGWQSFAQLGALRLSLLSLARSRNADLFIAHSATTLWVAERLKREGRRIGVDMEDWFSREHFAPYPSVRVAELEQSVLRQAAHATCTSEVMSRTLATEYNCPAPQVIYNAFPWCERKTLDGNLADRVDQRRTSLHWYSQTIGPGRGLEDLFSALLFLDIDIEVHLRGVLARGSESWLAAMTPKSYESRIFIHQPVRNPELLSRIAEHDIGFAGEPKVHRSRDVTVTNKMLQYLLAGLAVIASDTAGQLEIANQAPMAVTIYPAGDPEALAGSITKLASSTERLTAAKLAALSAARERFCWELIEPRLVENVRAAIERDF